MSENVFKEASSLWEGGQLERALSLFKSIAEEGDEGAQMCVGYFYDVGLSVSRDPHKALFWYKKAARQGSAAACSNVATVYKGSGNFQRARVWFLKAIKAGDGDAALQLAKMYLASKPRGYLQSSEEFLHLAQASKNITEDSLEQVRSLLAARKATEPA